MKGLIVMLNQKQHGELIERLNDFNEKYRDELRDSFLVSAVSPSYFKSSDTKNTPNITLIGAYNICEIAVDVHQIIKQSMVSDFEEVMVNSLYESLKSYNGRLFFNTEVKPVIERTGTYKGMTDGRAWELVARDTVFFNDVAAGLKYKFEGEHEEEEDCF